MTATPRLQRLLVPERISPGDMLVFGVVAREGGIRRGAQALRMPRSTVSRRLRELERALRGRVVSRSTHRFALTELGVALLAKCTELEALLESTRSVTDRIASEPTGTLSVAAPPAFGEELLPPVIEQYVKRFPRVRLTVDLSSDFVELGRASVDLALRVGPLGERTDLIATKIGSTFRGCYASRGYLKARGTPQTPEELGQHECIEGVGGGRSSVWAFRSQGAEVHVTVNGSLRVNNLRLARSAAASGLGIARLPGAFAQPLVDAGELVAVLEKFWPRTELFAVHAAGRPTPPKIRAFIELLRAENLK